MHVHKEFKGCRFQLDKLKACSERNMKPCKNGDHPTTYNRVVRIYRLSEFVSNMCVHGAGRTQSRLENQLWLSHVSWCNVCPDLWVQPTKNHINTQCMCLGKTKCKTEGRERENHIVVPGKLDTDSSNAKVILHACKNSQDLCQVARISANMHGLYIINHHRDIDDRPDLVGLRHDTE